MTSRARLVATACVIVGVLYFAKALYRGTSFTRGDFYFSTPGAYAERINPALWNSPDLAEALAFNHGAYLYGPTQYLTLFPIVFLSSYAAIASVLLVVYAVVLVAAWYLLWKLVTTNEPGMPGTAAVTFAIMFAFLPVTQALIQREFEVVALLALVLACLFYTQRRQAVTGVAVAYLTWFKYWSVVLLVSFVMHRRAKALLAFAIASVLLLGSTQLMFGLDRFVMGRTAAIVGGLVRPLGSGYVLYPAIERGAQKSDFCRQWIWGRGTTADVRWMLCGVEDRFPLLSAKASFYAMVVVTAVAFTWGALTLAKREGSTGPSKWAAIWEFSLLTIGGGAFVHAHYYYFIVFVLPLTALAFWYATRPQPWRRTKIALWVMSYGLLNALMLPTSWVSALTGQNVWALYLDSGLCLGGVLLLLGLVLWEFLLLSVDARRVLVPQRT